MKFHGLNNLEESIILDNDAKEEIVVEDCEEAIIEIGSNGKFQKLALALLTICYTCTGAFIINAFVFLEKDPPFVCFKDSEWKECKRNEACSENYNYVINYLDESNYSWTNDFKMDCDENYIIGLFGTCFFLGSMISSIFASSISDYIGRAKLIKLSMIIRTVIMLFPLIFPGKTIIITSLFLIGLVNSMHSTIPYILISEYVSRFEKDKYQTIMFVFESFSGLLATLYFFIFQNWRIYMLLNFLYGIIFTIFSYKLLESPRYLVSKNKFEEAREVLKTIAKINLGKDVSIRFERESIKPKDEIKKTVASDQTVSTSTLCKSNKLRQYIIILPFIWFTTAFAFFAINFEIKYLKIDLYLSNLLLFTSEGTTYLLSNKMMQYLGKKYSMIVSFMISAVSYFIFYFISHDSEYAVLILIYFSKLGASALLNISSIYSNEVFPTDLRGRAIAICSFVGKFGGILAPMIVEVSEQVLIISAFVCIFSSIALIPLENTFSNSYLVDNIQEVEEEKLDS